MFTATEVISKVKGPAMQFVAEPLRLGKGSTRLCQMVHRQNWDGKIETRHRVCA